MLVTNSDAHETRMKLIMNQWDDFYKDFNEGKGLQDAYYMAKVKAAVYG